MRARSVAFRLAAVDDDEAEPDRPRCAPATIVAIPARDEAVRIEQCLRALARQTTLCGAKLDTNIFGVLLLLNNCRDGTAKVARRLVPRLPYDLAIRECELPPEFENAASARRLAMDSAAAWLSKAGRPDGYLLTTDADTRVAPDWIARQHAAFARGADAVAGFVIDDSGEHRRLPAELRRRARLEARYTWLLTELESILDPDPHDRWPRHAMAAGASLGVRLSWYLRIGGVPLRPLGEDRALVERLRAAGARVRHCVQTWVVTSCRLDGRAAGGMADTMRQRIAEPDALCDPSLEPADMAARRYLWRGRLRRRYRDGQLADFQDRALRQAVPAEVAAKIIFSPSFEAVWEAVEAHSPHLHSRLLRPDQLPAEIGFAKQLLRSLGSLAAVADAGENHRCQVPVCAPAAVNLSPRISPEHRANTVDAGWTGEAAEVLA